MKRYTSILLLVALSMTTIRATFVAHYCGEELRAIGLAGGDAEAGCCDGEMEEIGGEDTYIYDPNERCCRTITFELSTEEYRTCEFVASTDASVAAILPKEISEPNAIARVPYIYRSVSPSGKHPPSRDLLALLRVARI
jgi:hypothetical protein